MPASKQHRMDVPTQADAAWAAGVYSGEGSVTVHRIRGCAGVRFTVGQSSNGEECPEMLIRLVRIFGGPVYKMGYKKHAHHRTIWQYYLHNHGAVQAAVAFMWRWLTPEKKEQAAAALGAWKLERTHALGIS